MPPKWFSEQPKIDFFTEFSGRNTDKRKQTVLKKHLMPLTEKCRETDEDCKPERERLNFKDRNKKTTIIGPDLLRSPIQSTKLRVA